MGVMPVFPGYPRQGWQFIVRVNGFDTGYFQKATIPEVETEIDEFNPAGSVRPTKFAGRMKIGDCTLEKGMLSDRADMDTWMWLTGQYSRDIEICHVNRVGVVIQTWILKEAFCSKVTWSDDEGSSSDHMVETLTLTVGDVEVV